MKRARLAAIWKYLRRHGRGGGLAARNLTNVDRGDLTAFGFSDDYGDLTAATYSLDWAI